MKNYKIINFVYFTRDNQTIAFLSDFRTKGLIVQSISKCFKTLVHIRTQASLNQVMRKT